MKNKFEIGDIIRFKKGMYKGHIGEVIQVTQGNEKYPTAYMLRLTPRKGSHSSFHYFEDTMEKASEEDAAKFLLESL